MGDGVGGRKGLCGPAGPSSRAPWKAQLPYCVWEAAMPRSHVGHSTCRVLMGTATAVMCPAKPAPPCTPRSLLALLSQTLRAHGVAAKASCLGRSHPGASACLRVLGSSPTDSQLPANAQPGRRHGGWLRDSASCHLWDMIEFLVLDSTGQPRCCGHLQAWPEAAGAHLHPTFKN